MRKYLLLFMLIFTLSLGDLFAVFRTGPRGNISAPSTTEEYKLILNSENGSFYSHIVLLFNENPHFLNVAKEIDLDASYAGSYTDYYLHFCRSLPKGELRQEAFTVLRLYNFPALFTEDEIRLLEEKLEKRDIIAKFIMYDEKYSLDYCIFGRRKEINAKHPFLHTNNQIYNIEPIIYYDEFYSSNSTFYNDLIYVDLHEVENDSRIAKKIVANESTENLYYVGSQVTPEIESCLKKAFPDETQISDRISNIFVVHELTHKILNIKYNYYNRIVEEELAIASTIYVEPHLGLSVLYSYLNYYRYSPHRIAALKFFRYAADQLDTPQMMYTPSLIKELPKEQLRSIAKSYFDKRISHIKDKQAKPAAKVKETKQIKVGFSKPQ